MATTKIHRGSTVLRLYGSNEASVVAEAHQGLDRLCGVQKSPKSSAARLQHVDAEFQPISRIPNQSKLF